eukprot:gene33948-biopygen26875
MVSWSIFPVKVINSSAQAPEKAPQREVLRITSNDNLVYFNVDQKLTLSGTIFSNYQCFANWTIRNSSITLGSILITPVTGYEVEKPFIFRAMNWIDKDLPLDYQFSYTTAQNFQLGIGDSSPYRNFTTSLLPAGSATARHSLNCSMRVYDAYGAVSRAATSVTVRPVSNHVAQAFVLSAINTSASSGIQSLSVINLLGTLLSKTVNPDEISKASASAVLGISNSLLLSARQFKVDQQDISSQLLSSIDAVATAWNPVEQSPESVIETLQNMVFFSSLQMYPSQDSIPNVLSNFKASVNTLSSTTIAIPQSPLEVLAGEQSSKVDLSDLVSDDFSVVQSTRVSLVQLKASFFSKNSSFKSNPLVITHSVSQSQHLNLSSRFIIATLVNNVPYNATSKVVNFSTVCHRRQYLFRSSSSHRYVCPSSGYVIVHNCTNKVGVLTTACPQYQPSCSSFVDAHHPSCTLLSFTANLTVCNCSLSEGSASTHRRLDSSSGDIAVTTTLQLVSTGRYLVEQVGETFRASPSLASPDAIEHVVIVISMFASLWVVGFALVAVGRWAKGNKIKVRGEEKPFQRDAAPLSIRQEFSAYIEEVIPSIFRGESDSWKSIREVFRRHKYAALVYTSNLNLFNVTRIVTVQSMLMFILAVTYDLQAPSDDGSCIQWQIESTCIERKSYLDSTQSYCQWGLTSTDDMGSSVSGYTCSYRDPYPTPQEVLSVTVIVSVLTALFLRPMEYLFKILSAPISNRVIVPSSNRKDRGKGNEDSSFAELLKNHHISKMAGIQVRDIPETAIVTRSMARKSFRGLNKVSPPSGGQLDLAVSHHGISIEFHITDNDFSKNVLKLNLAKAINRQRRILSGMELDEFDSQWGILRHSETILARSQSSDLSALLFIAGMFDRIYHDVESVRSRALAKIEALRVT